MGKLTVLENMRLGAADQSGERLSRALFRNLWGTREKEITDQAEVLLQKFKLDTKRDDYAASLSGGQRKLLEMARSLMARPKLVMLDEPMAGVNPALTQSLLDHVKNLKAEGMTVLFVEHDMQMVRHIADWVVVMAEGKIVAEGPPVEVMKDQAVIDAYLGAHHDVDLGDTEGVQALEQELAQDQESVVGTEDEGIIGQHVAEQDGRDDGGRKEQG
jgi:ABC-type branched-subunit amino acid transport system ATPase component